MREKEVLVIIPAYNEAANIGKVLDQAGKARNIRDCRCSCYE